MPLRRVPVDGGWRGAARRRAGRRPSRAERISLGGNAIADDADVDAGASFEPRSRSRPAVGAAPRGARRRGRGGGALAPPAPARATAAGRPPRADARERGDVDAFGAAEVLTPVRRSARSVTGSAAPALDLLGVTNLRTAQRRSSQAATAEARAGGFAASPSRVMAPKVAATGGAGVEDVKGIGPARSGAVAAACTAPSSPR